MSDVNLLDRIDELESLTKQLVARVGLLEAPNAVATLPALAATAPGLAEAPAAETATPTAKGSGDDDAALARGREELEALERELTVARTRLGETRVEAEAEARRAADASRHLAAERTALAERAAVVQAEVDKLAGTRRVLERIWPRFLLTAPFAGWKTLIETALLQETPPASAALLFANLHGYTACLLEADQKYLRDVLRDISRFLLAWLKEDGHDEGAAYQVALTWAEALNGECAGKCVVEMPEPGTPANNQWMTFPPRGGSSPDVLTVKTWCVRDAQNRVIHRAEVFTA